MVLIAFHWCVKRFTCRQMPAAHFALLMQFAQIAVNRCQTHGSRLPLQAAMQLLTGHLGFTFLQLLQQQLLPLRTCGSVVVHGDV
jgi:hypothetical protein